MSMRPLIDQALCRRIAEVFRRHDYTEQNVVGTLGAATASVLNFARLGPMMQRTAAGRPLDTLIRLFVIGNRVDEVALAAIVAPTTVDEWCSLGVLERIDGQVRAALGIRAFGDYLLAADIAARAGQGGIADDFVMGMSPSTLGLASLTVRRPSRATLDLASGGGYHALLAAAHSERVVATDLNERAVWMAHLNVALNDLEHIDVRQGDLFAPADGETFDLIVSNPPFVVGPDITHQFLSTDREGDGLCRELAKRAPEYLNEGGYCQFLANWISVKDEPWWDRVGSWFEGSGCDVWVIRVSSDRPDDYAATWISAMMAGDDEFERRFAAWMRFYESVHADGIGFGLVTMRKRSGAATWSRFDDITDAFGTGTGDDVARIFDLQTWLADVDDDQLLDASLVVAAEARAVQQLAWREGEWTTESVAFKRVTGFRFGGSIDSGALELLSSLDGTRSLREAIALVAEEEPSPEVAATIAEAVRQLVARGLLLPAG